MIPIVVDLGKAKRKDLEALQKGQGPLVAEVEDAVNQVLAALSPEVKNGKKLVPVVVEYKKKQRALNWMLGR
jgi:hypothetical protein